MLVTFCDSRQQDQLVWLWNGLRKMADGELDILSLKEDLEEMGVDWSGMRDFSDLAK